jgi:X-Pro dipeptidyl-peptidase
MDRDFVRALLYAWDQPDFRAGLQPKDYVFPAGHRIGLVAFSSDQEHTLLPSGGTRLRVAPNMSELRILVVGGRPVLGF